MISSIFFEKTCDLSKPYLYDEIVVNYLVAKCFKEKKSFYQTKAFINDFYGNTHSFSSRAFDDKYSEKSFIGPNYDYAFEKLESFKEQFFLNEWESDERLLTKINCYHTHELMIEKLTERAMFIMKLHSLMLFPMKTVCSEK